MNDDGITTNCVLTCGCARVLVGERRMGQTIYCRIHQRVVIIVSNLPEYRSVCQQPRCGYGTRYHGQAPLTAVTKASSHAVRYRHVVLVYHGSVLHEECGSAHRPAGEVGAQLALPLPVAGPQRAARGRGATSGRSYRG